MCYEIIVGGRRLGLLDSVSICRSVETLCDTATIVVPATFFNSTLDIEKYLVPGEYVEIELGYDNALEIEFKGYLKSISTDDNHLTLVCEDELYLWDKKLPNKEYKNIKLKSLLTDLARSIDADYTVDTTFDFTYEKFITYHSTGYDVLKKIQEETRANIWFDGKTLHVQPQYATPSGKVIKFDFARNIESSDLKYRKASERNIEVEITYHKPDGKTGTEKFGRQGGQLVKEFVPGVSSGSAKAAAKNVYDMLCYDGYEGSFKGWLVPFVEPCDAVHLHDEDYPYKDGKYYVIGTEVSFSKEGGRRTIKIGRIVE